jgi:hypothetical protein
VARRQRTARRRADAVKADLKFGEREKKRLAGPFGFRGGAAACPFYKRWCNLEQRNISQTLRLELAANIATLYPLNSDQFQMRTSAHLVVQ